jgi:hypothetical protein
MELAEGWEIPLGDRFVGCYSVQLVWLGDFDPEWGPGVIGRSSQTCYAQHSKIVLADLCEILGGEIRKAPRIIRAADTGHDSVRVPGTACICYNNKVKFLAGDEGGD